MLPLTYPDPHVPKSPVLGWSSFRDTKEIGADERFPSVLTLAHRQYVTSARVAIALALQRLGVGAGDRVLVPAYHCLSMVEPVLFCGAEPLFFPLTPTLEVPLATLEGFDLSNVKAMLVTHYFGFPQAMQAISRFARERGIAVIEDCAHAVFGSTDGRPVGAWGDYAAVSLMKFFPVYDGGCLASSSNPLTDLVLTPPSRRFEVKAFFNTVERGLRYRRFPGIQVAARTTLRIKDAVWHGIKRLRSRGDPTFSYHDPAASEGVSGLDPSWMHCRMSIASQALVERLPLGRVISRRRENYARLLAGLSALPGARPLFPRLPIGVVPYVFPLLVDRPERVFALLKQDGVPLFRWERLWNDEAVRVDPLSARYATEIFQLPCHQELDEEDVNWMIGRIQAAFQRAEPA